MIRRPITAQDIDLMAQARLSALRVGIEIEIDDMLFNLLGWLPDDAETHDITLRVEAREAELMAADWQRGAVA